VPPQQQPHPPQYAYGQQFPGQPPPGPGWGPPPPNQNNAGKVIAIIVGCLVVLSLVGYVVKQNARNGGTGGSAPEYELSMPKTLVDGKYKLAKDMSEASRAKNPDLRSGDQQYVGIYSAGSAKEQILYSGLNSGNTGGDQSDDKILDGMEDDPQVDVAVPRREIDPGGSDEPLNCEVITKSEGGEDLSVATCAWSDPGSVATVSDNSYKSLLTDPDEIDLEAFADQVNTIRDEVRSPAE